MREMILYYRAVLLDIDLFLKEAKNREITEKDQDLLEKLYERYPLYLIGKMSEEELTVTAEMMRIMPYIKTVFSLEKAHPMGNIMNRLGIHQLEAYLVCGTNADHEIALANRAYMNSCYVGKSDSFTAFNSTYQVERKEDIKRLLKLPE